MRRVLPVLWLAIALTGCWNGHNNHVSLGDVSLGQQLIDLKRARDEGTMSDAEYEAVRSSLIALADRCGVLEGAIDEDDAS